MAVRGSEAKENILNELRGLFGDRVVNVIDGKMYVESQEKGEVVQVAIALTCPKTPVERAKEVSSVVDVNSFDWGESVPQKKDETKISKEEQETIVDLIKRLGL